MSRPSLENKTNKCEAAQFGKTRRSLFYRSVGVNFGNYYRRRPGDKEISRGLYRNGYGC